MTIFRRVAGIGAAAMTLFFSANALASPDLCIKLNNGQTFILRAFKPPKTGKCTAKPLVGFYLNGDPFYEPFFGGACTAANGVALVRLSGGGASVSLNKADTEANSTFFQDSTVIAITSFSPCGPSPFQ